MAEFSAQRLSGSAAQPQIEIEIEIGRRPPQWERVVPRHEMTTHEIVARDSGNEGGVDTAMVTSVKWF